MTTDVLVKQHKDGFSKAAEDRQFQETVKETVERIFVRAQRRTEADIARILGKPGQNTRTR